MQKRKTKQNTFEKGYWFDFNTYYRTIIFKLQGLFYVYFTKEPN